MKWVLLGNSPVSPESLDLAIRHNDACERDKGDDDQRVDERCEDRVGRIGCNCLSDSRVEEFVHNLWSYSQPAFMTVSE